MLPKIKQYSAIVLILVLVIAVNLINSGGEIENSGGKILFKVLLLGL